MTSLDSSLPAAADMHSLLLDALPICVLLGDDHVFVLVNDAFQALFPDRPFIDRPFREVFPELGDTEVLWILDDVYTSGEPATAGELRAREDRADLLRDIYLSFRVSPIRGRDGGIHALLCVGIDVTAQVASRRRVEALERRSAFLAEASATLASSLQARDTLSTVAHLAVEHFADWCALSLVGNAANGELGPGCAASADRELQDIVMEAHLAYPIVPEDLSLAGRALACGEPLLMVDCLRADPPFTIPRDARHAELLTRFQPRSAMAVPLRVRGETLGVMTLGLIKPGRPYGAEDLALADELARHAAFAVENSRLYHAAQEGIRVREEFLSIAGHELKTPLTALKLNLQGLERAAQRNDKRTLMEHSERLTKMGKQTARLERLVNELLDVSRVSAGRLILEPEEVDLVAIVAEVVARAEDDLGESGSNLTVAARAPVVGEWDATRLDQVVTNLVSNAIKYGQGKPIQIQVEQDGLIARLRVRDHGIGIPRDKQPRIFDRFERAVSDRHYGGFGLGLWIVRRIVEASGGAIRFESVPPAGTVFIVELPLRAGAGDPEP